jgi:hypothetical protein
MTASEGHDIDRLRQLQHSCNAGAAGAGIESVSHTRFADRMEPRMQSIVPAAGGMRKIDNFRPPGTIFSN